MDNRPARTDEICLAHTRRRACIFGVLVGHVGGQFLVTGGLFIFNLCVDTGKPGYLRDSKGNAWCDHYGQFTAVPKADLHAELGALFGVLSVTQRDDGIFNFVLRARTFMPRPDVAAALEKIAWFIHASGTRSADVCDDDANLFAEGRAFAGRATRVGLVRPQTVLRQSRGLLERSLCLRASI